MKEKILKLRNKGKSYREIEKILGCSKGLISYHCGKGQKEKTLIRQVKNRKTLNRIIRSKINSFLVVRVRNFKRGTKRINKSSKFNYDSAYRKICNNPFCYLTGKKIDLTDIRSYSLDHIIPCSKGGKNTLKNMGLLCKDVNYAKGNLSINDFIKLCVDVCEYNGYSVKKK